MYYIFTIVASTSTSIVYANFYSESPLISAILGLFVVLLIIFLVILFVYKLYNVHKESEQNGEGIKSVIIKTSVLAFVSIFSTILIFIATPLSPVLNSIHWNFIRELCLICDVYTNCVCTLLANHYMESYYVKLCGCCDSTCHRLWSSCLRGKDLEAAVEITRVELNNAH